MFDSVLGLESVVDIDGTSDGTQLKFRDGDFWYKQDYYGGEGRAECVASMILSCTDLNCSEYVVYESGVVNGRDGCRSKDFLNDGYEFVTLYRFYALTAGRKLNEVVNRFNTPEERADFVLNYFDRECGLDLSNYFAKIFTLDYLILNEDRHFNNLGIVRTPEHKYIAAPIFDNGKSLLVGNQSVNDRVSMDENIKRVVARPFSGSHEKNYTLFGKGFIVNADKITRLLGQYQECREKEAFLCQLGILEKKHPEMFETLKSAKGFK